MKQFSFLLTFVVFLLAATFSSKADCITDPPTANAGPDLQKPPCSNPFSVTGTIGGSATGCTWTSNGTGMILNTNSTTVTYIPSMQDLANGSVTLTITATGNGCTPVSDDAVIGFPLYTPPYSSGPDQTVCSTVSFVQLNGTAFFAGAWQKVSGSGTFSPNNTSVTAQYIPSASDITNGSVILRYTGSADPCGFTPTMTIRFVRVNSNPNNTSICENAAASFSTALTTGYTGPVTYQWQVNQGSGFTNVNTTDYNNSTTAALTLKANVANNAYNGYQYRCVIGACSTSYTTSAATLTVKSNTLTATAPTDQHTCAGGSAVFVSTVAPSTSGVTYRWAVNTGSGFSNLNNSTNVSGVFTSALTLNNVTPAMEGYLYRLTATNGCASNAVTAPAGLFMANLAIASAPQPSTACAGDSTGFQLQTEGDAVTSWQWQVNDGSGFTDVADNAQYSGATSAVLSVKGVTAAMDGYTYQCLVKSGCTTSGLLSGTAQLSVNDVPVINSSPSDQTVCAGTDAIFTAEVLPVSSLTYQWQVNDGSGYANLSDDGTYSNTSTAVLTMTGATAAQDGFSYRLLVHTSGCGSAVFSEEAVLHVTTVSLNLNQQPESITAWNGGGVAFQCTSAEVDVSYQWEIKAPGDPDFSMLDEGNGYSGTSTSMLTLSATDAGMDGTLYRCRVQSTACPSVNAVSDEALLSIAAVEICLVTVDDVSGKPMIVFDKPSNLDGVDSFLVYREKDAEGFEQIGRIAKDASGVFVDQDSDPVHHSYTYRLAVLNANEQEFPASASSVHTINLLVAQGTGSTVELQWNSYDGNSDNTYKVFRGTDASSMTLLTSVPDDGTSYTDATAPEGTEVLYQIELELATACNPAARTSEYASVKSNVSEAIMVITGIDHSSSSENITFYPNPALELVTLEGLSGEETIVTVWDVQGNAVLQTASTDSSLQLSLDGWTKGVYLVELRTASMISRKSLLVH